MTKEDTILSRNVIPYYIKAPECFLLYTDDTVNKDARYDFLAPDYVKQKFGFNLLCDHLGKTVQEAQKFLQGKKIGVYYAEASYEMNEMSSKAFLVVHQFPGNMGYGVSSYATLPAKHIIAEYVGERKPFGRGELPNDYTALTKVNSKDFKWKSHDGNFVINANDLDNDIANIDTKTYGNIARFFNHCPQEHENEEVLTANLDVTVWPISSTMARVFLVTNREIKAFEPLCWDYGPTYEHKDMVLLNGETFLPIEETNGDL